MTTQHGSQTYWQRLAASTNGIVTPGNIFTVAGGLITLAGLWLLYVQLFWPAVLTIGAGRVCDLLDGYAARRTRTVNALGELLDAATDKIVLATAGLVLAVRGIAPLWLILSLLVIELCIVGVAFTARTHGVPLHSSRTGKYSTFVLWATVIAYATAHFLESRGEAAGHTIYIAASWAAVLVLGGCLAALAGYTRGLKDGLRHKDRS